MSPRGLSRSAINSFANGLLDRLRAWQRRAPSACGSGSGGCWKIVCIGRPAWWLRQPARPASGRHPPLPQERSGNRFGGRGGPGVPMRMRVISRPCTGDASTASLSSVVAGISRAAEAVVGALRRRGEQAATTTKPIGRCSRSLNDRQTRSACEGYPPMPVRRPARRGVAITSDAVSTRTTRHTVTIKFAIPSSSTPLPGSMTVVQSSCSMIAGPVKRAPVGRCSRR